MRLTRVVSAAAAAPLPSATCVAALQRACGRHKGDAFACAQCAGDHQRALARAGCQNRAISAWCAGAAPPSACGIQYTVVRDAWRAVNNTCCVDQFGQCYGPGDHGTHDKAGWPSPTPNRSAGWKTMADFPSNCTGGGIYSGDNFQETGLGGDRWYRFEGAGGNALARTPPPFDTVGCNQWDFDRLYCGTSVQVRHFTRKILLAAHAVFCWVGASVDLTGVCL